MNNYFDHKLTYKGITFQLTNKTTPDEREIHTYHEILYFIRGKADLLTENARQKLKDNTLLIIPKNTYHFLLLSKAPFIRLKISISESFSEDIPIDDIMGSFKAVDNIPESVSLALDKIVRLLQDKDSNKKEFYLYVAFLTLVAELDAGIYEKGISSNEKNSLVSEIIRYISRNLSGDLSVMTLARKMNVSSSSIIHNFKNELGISLHNYITQRRLIYARELISKGNKPSKIYMDCGYMEYSSFYRAYIKFFGHPPSKEKSNI